MIQGGSTANRNGAQLEAQVDTCIRHTGYRELTEVQKRMLVSNGGVLITEGSKWYVRQVRISKSIYELPMTTDFYVYNAEKWPDGLYIEVKWQSTGGSVDEKYVFTALSMMKQKGDKILIIDGGGCRAGAILWMRKQAERKANRFQIFNMMEFFKWAKHSL